MDAPAGWYDDGSGRQRWWDGQQWTEQYADAATDVPATHASPGVTETPTIPVTDAPGTTPLVSGVSGKAKGLAIAALVVGIVAFLTGLVPVLGILLGLAGVGLGIFALLRRQSKGLGVTAIVLAGIAVLASTGMTLGIAAIGTHVASTASSADAEPEATVPAESAVPVETTTPSPVATTPPPAVPDVPVEYRSALTKATQYSNILHMSKAGVYRQLTSEYGEKFSPEAAQYAIDNVKADWNANALAKAKDYQSQMSMSPEAIRDQLTSEYGEQFTQEEADYAVQHLNG